MVPVRGSLYPVPAPSAMGRRLPLSGVRRGQGLADEPGRTSVHPVSTTDVGDRWDNL
jgi:hypothetical protein